MTTTTSYDVWFRSGVLSEFGYAATAGEMPVVVVGNPFDLPKPAVDEAVIAAMLGHNRGAAVRFVQAPAEIARSRVGYAVVMLLNPGPGVGADLACAGRASVPPATGGGGTTLLAVFCGNADARSWAFGVVRAGRSDGDLDATDGDGDAGAEFEQLRADGAAGRLRQLGVRQTDPAQGPRAARRRTTRTTAAAGWRPLSLSRCGPGSRPSLKHAATRPISPIARSVSRSNTAPASDVTAPPSNAATTRRPSNPSNSSWRYTLSASDAAPESINPLSQKDDLRFLGPMHLPR